MVKENPQPLSGLVMPRFGEVATFMRLPVERDPAKLDIALVGVPWDGGTTNRPGARHGPREIRSMSTLMRRVHHVSLVAPYELCRVGDHGDAPVNPIDLMDALKRIEAFYGRLYAAGAAPPSAGDGPAYVSFDVDGLDPVYAPGTGTPEIGGFSTAEAQRMIRALDGLDLVGGDVVEVAPPFDPSGNTALVGATMMFEILCVLAPAVHRRKNRMRRL